MKALVTGATGFVGFHVAKYLLRQGASLRALVREGNDASELEKLDVEICRGDIRDAQSVRHAVEGCRQVYHVAADYRLWVPDPHRMYETNVHGTRNVMQAALDLGVEKVVYTSSAGTLVSKKNNSAPFCEETPVELTDMVGHYKRSKFLAEREVGEFIRKGLPVVIVNPTTPIGAYDRKPTPTGKVIVDFLNGKIPAFIQTGLNFVDVEEAACGHWLAACHGKIGEKYILGNTNISLSAFFQTLAQASGLKPPRVRLPYGPVLFAAYLDEIFSRWVTHSHPRIPLTGVKMAKTYMYFDCSKAVRELHMSQAPIETAVYRAVDWYREKGYVRNTPSGGRHG